MVAVQTRTSAPIRRQRNKVEVLEGKFCSLKLFFVLKKKTNFHFTCHTHMALYVFPGMHFVAAKLHYLLRHETISFGRRNYKQLLDEVFVISIIIKVEVGVFRLYYTLNESFLSRFDIKCFQSLCQLFLFLRFSHFFLFHVISKQLLCHLR